MKTGIEIANNFTYLYKNIDYMKDHDNFDLFNKITKKSSPLFVKGGDIISRNPLIAGYHEIDVEELIRSYRDNGYSDFLIDIGANIGLTTCFSGKGFGVHGGLLSGLQTRGGQQLSEFHGSSGFCACWA